MTGYDPNDQLIEWDNGDIDKVSCFEKNKQEKEI